MTLPVKSKTDTLEQILSKYNGIFKNLNLTLTVCKTEEKKELYEFFLEIIKEGNSYPQTLPFSYEEFLNYFFPDGSIVLICKSQSTIIGSFFLKPNFPGRCSHIANAGYIVKKKYRGKKIGFYLGKCSIDIAKKVGYRALMFNLVFKENTNSLNLWNKLGFKILATIPQAVKKDDGNYQDAYIMYLNLV